MDLDRFLRIYKEIRPRPHNRNAWLIILGGLGLLANPIWISFAAAAARKYFSLDVSGIQGETTVTGLALIALGLVYQYFSEKLLIANTSINSENDKVVANRFWKIYDEQRIDGILGYELWNGYIHQENDKSLDDIREFSTITQNGFNDLQLEQERQTLSVEIRNLIHFSAVHFFYRREQMNPEIRYLYPDLNFELDGDYDEKKMEKYNKRFMEFRSLIDSFDAALKNFVTTLKKHDLFMKD